MSEKPREGPGFRVRARREGDTIAFMVDVAFRVRAEYVIPVPWDDRIVREMDDGRWFFATTEGAKEIHALWIEQVTTEGTAIWNEMANRLVKEAIADTAGTLPDDDE